MAAVMSDRYLLHVEDNQDDVELTRRALERAGAREEIIVASDGAVAIDLLHGPDALEQLPALVLLDLKLPKLSGLEVLRLIREHARTRLLPVVVLTTSAQEEDVGGAYALGANGFVRKAIEAEEFHDAVQAIVDYWLRTNLPAPPIF